MKPSIMFRRLQVIFHLSGLLPNYNSCMFILFFHFNTIIIVAKDKYIALEYIMRVIFLHLHL